MPSPLKVQVDALSEQRWTRIERSLFARHQAELLATDAEPTPRAERRLQLFALLAGVVAIAALALVLVRGALPAAPAALETPSRITTGSTPSHLALPGLSLDVKPESTVVVGADTNQGQLIVVDRGSIACEVAPRAAGAPLIIQAGGARVRVVGTRFTVSRSGESARVDVEHGVVEVSENGRTWRVSAGQTWSAEASPLPQPTAEPSASAPVAPPPASAPPSAEARDLRIAPRPRPVAAPGHDRDDHPARTVPAAQATFEEAARLEAREPARAAALYQSLEAGRDVWAQNALYAHGRLEAARGNRVGARRLLTQYLANFSHGTNADDARTVLGRLK